MRYAKLPPLNINRDTMAVIEKFAHELKLTMYETDVLKVLVAADRPMLASEVSNYSNVPRTKTYGTLKKLVRRGFAVLMVKDEDDMEKPEIWEWWPDTKQNRYLNDHLVGYNIYTVNWEYLKNAFNDWYARHWELMMLMTLVIQGLDAQAGVEVMVVES